MLIPNQYQKVVVKSSYLMYNICIEIEEANMNVLRSEVVAKLEEWSQEDFNGCRGVWMEKNAFNESLGEVVESFEDFCMKVAAQNVLFEKLELAGELS